MKRPIYYSQFDGEDINGTRYGLGDAIDEDTPGAILEILAQQGRIAASKPTVITAPLVGSDKAIEDMNRSELEGAALSAFTANMGKATDDELRSAVERQRAALAETDGDDDDGADDEKPLARQNTAELTATAEREGVTFGDDVKTNSDRVAAIEAARAAKAG